MLSDRTVKEEDRPTSKQHVSASATNSNPEVTGVGQYGVVLELVPFYSCMDATFNTQGTACQHKNDRVGCPVWTLRPMSFPTTPCNTRRLSAGDCATVAEQNVLP